jgi:hypothetical protein
MRKIDRMKWLEKKRQDEGEREKKRLRERETDREK